MRKLIFVSQDRAERMLAKVAKHRPGRKFEVYRITSKAGEHLGWQVLEIHSCASAVRPWPPKPIGESQLLAQIGAEKPIEVAKIEAKLAQETRPAWLGRRCIPSFGPAL